jgi:hypothetical protein
VFHPAVSTGVLAKVSSVRYSVHMASVKFPTFPSIDFSKLDLDKLTKIELPSIDLPTIDLPKIDTAAITSAVKDAGYITVGLAVLAVQKAQVRRVEMQKAFTDQFGNGRAQIDELVDAAQGAAKAARDQVRHLLSSVA